MKKQSESLKERLLRVSWPHTANGRKWRTDSEALTRLDYYGKKLLKLGMTADEVASMFGDTYWDAFNEFRNMHASIESEQGVSRKAPCFDETVTMFRLDATLLSPEELKRDYNFYFNAFLENGSVVWARRGGGSCSHSLPTFLDIVQDDNNFAFGPAKSVSGWTIAKLAEVNAVGLYKRKEQ
ncbi:hypothetical protein [Roseimicrobium sp. ORNL1]|uniref:hypothetical protein n=1 Tax=Roseimicrobium sp. ORNL1 TaxID=2711231 RepID=UPI0013E1DA4A|nr:hypothetical protein [Roseimicrobium sp. ORNL1]QIF05187.1 hypothetical protein G5S37_27965 [Roseimicrobium sp. ORNL1]